MKKTVMIVGAGSFLGSNLISFLKNDYRLVTTHHKMKLPLPGINSFSMDVLKKEEVTKLISYIRPDITVYAAGMNSLSECKLRPKLADALNTAGAVNVCSASERYGAKFVLISSAYVMGGENLLYKEGDLPMPTTAYGHSLAAAEFYVQRSCLNYLILRCSELYGVGLNPQKPNFYEFVLSKLAKGEAILADDSVVCGHLDVEIMARILKIALDQNVTNRLFQVSSSDYTTRYQFSCELAAAFNLNTRLVQKQNSYFPSDSPSKESGFSFKMDISNLESFLNTKMPSIADSLSHTHKRI